CLLNTTNESVNHRRNGGNVIADHAAYALRRCKVILHVDDDQGRACGIDALFESQDRLLLFQIDHFVPTRLRLMPEHTRGELQQRQLPAQTHSAIQLEGRKRLRAMLEHVFASQGPQLALASTAEPSPIPLEAVNMERIGFCFLDRPSVEKQIELVKKIERLGYESAWVTEPRLARDAFTVLGAFAAVTSRTKLCTGIVNSWTRGAALMAMTLATLDEL